MLEWLKNSHKKEQSVDRSQEKNPISDAEEQGLVRNPLLYYGKSMIGESHIKKGTVCQDYSKVVTLKNGWCAAAVADGVGSARYSDIASQIAVETFVEICYQNLTDSNFDAENIKRIIFASYMTAQKRIEDYAYQHEQGLIDYDTTLSCIVYDGRRIVYGHSGDGGIVGLTAQGEYRKITQPQKAEDGICVIPLRAGAKAWVIGECSGEFSSVLLATDGIYDTFFPYLLKGQRTEIYVPLIQFFMDNNILNAHESTISEIEKSRLDYLCGDVYSSVKDDKTILVVINPNIIPAQLDEAYYQEPDWNYLQEEWNKKAYPHLYQHATQTKDEAMPTFDVKCKDDK